MQIKVKLNKKAARDILTTAVQSGSAYWAKDYGNLREERDAEHYTACFRIGNPLKGAECDEPPRHRSVKVSDIGRAVQRLIDTQGRPEGVHPTFVSSLLAACDKDGCGADAIECDAVLQMAVFERVVYG